MNELHDLHDLFSASVGAAAALLGLLFVAISVGLERVFGPGAGKQRADAERAFTALGNVFFVSLAALLGHGVRTVLIVVAVLAIVQSFQMGWRRYRLERNWRNIGLISICAYAFQLYAALTLDANPASADRIVFIVFVLYGYALGTSWGLLAQTTGAERR